MTFSSSTIYKTHAMLRQQKQNCSHSQAGIITSIMLLNTLRLWILTFYIQILQAQLIGPVGPTTPLSEKTHECDITDYGAVSDNKTDVSPAINAAFYNCVLQNPNSRLIIPKGDYILTKSVTLVNGTNWALQLDGLITAQYGGNWTVERGDILQGFVGVEALNNTINGEGDQHFLLDVLVIVNGEHHRDNLFKKA